MNSYHWWKTMDSIVGSELLPPPPAPTPDRLHVAQEPSRESLTLSTNQPSPHHVTPSCYRLPWSSFFYLFWAHITGQKGLRSRGSTASLPDPIWLAQRPISATWFFPGEYSAISPFDYLFLVIVELIWLHVHGTKSVVLSEEEMGWFRWWDITYTYMNHTKRYFELEGP